MTKEIIFINSRSRQRHTDIGRPDDILQRLEIIILTLMETERSSTQDRSIKYRRQHITEIQAVSLLLYAAAIMPVRTI